MVSSCLVRSQCRSRMHVTNQMLRDKRLTRKVGNRDSSFSPSTSRVFSLMVASPSYMDSESSRRSSTSWTLKVSSNSSTTEANSPFHVRRLSLSLPLLHTILRLRSSGLLLQHAHQSHGNHGQLPYAFSTLPKPFAAEQLLLPIRPLRAFMFSFSRLYRCVASSFRCPKKKRIKCASVSWDVQSPILPSRSLRNRFLKRSFVFQSVT